MTRGSFAGMKNFPQPVIYAETLQLCIQKLCKTHTHNTYMCVRDEAIICLDGAGCQAVPVKGSNVAVVSWWLAQISRKRAKRGI